MHTPVKKKKPMPVLPTCAADKEPVIYDLTVDDDAEFNIPIAALLAKGSKKKISRNAAGTVAKGKKKMAALTPAKKKVVEKQLPRESPLSTIHPNAQPIEVENSSYPRC